MASSTPDGSVNYDMTDSSSRGWIVCEEQNEAQSNVSSVTSLHAAREWARSTETEEASMGITCNAAGALANDTGSSEAAVAVRQEMKQQEVIEKPEKTGWRYRSWRNLEAWRFLEKSYAAKCVVAKLNFRGDAGHTNVVV